MNTVSSQVLTEEISERLFNLLDTAIEIDKADKGNIQLFDAKEGTLRIIAQKGFDQAFLEHFKVVKAFDSSACGRAIGIGSTVVISDVMQDIGFTPHRAMAKANGFRAVKSEPLIINEEKFIGVLSTHFKDPQWHWETKKLNLIASKIANLLEGSSDLLVLKKRLDIEPTSKGKNQPDDDGIQPSAIA